MSVRRIVITATMIFALCTATVALAASQPLVLGDVTLDEYPRVGLKVTVPGELSATGSNARFTVKENGRNVEVLKAAQPKTEPVDVVLVIDTSGSMQGDAMAAARDAADAFAARLEQDSRVAIIAFANRPRLVRPLSTVGPGLSGDVASLDAQGETALYDGLAMAAREAQRVEVRRPVIVLLSDGGDTVSRSDLDTVLKQVRAATAPVLVVALPSAEADFGILRSIAAQSGGRFSTVAHTDQLTRFYESLAKELQTTWQVTYVSNRPSTKDLDIEVSVEAGGKEASGGSVVQNPVFRGVSSEVDALAPVAPASLLTLVAAVLLVFISVAAAAAAGALLIIRPRTTLSHVRYYDQMQKAGVGEGEGEYSGKMTSSILGAVEYIAGKRGMKRFVYEQLERAGLPIRPTEYIAGHLILVLVAGVFVQVTLGKILLSILAVVMATVLPIIWVGSRRASRQRAFDDQLPDVLNLMAGSLRAGWGLQQSIDLVVEQMNDPVSTEFQRAQTEVRLGRAIEDGLMSIADRIESDDFRWAVTAIGIQRDVGGNLAEVLDIVAKTIRDRSALRRQIAALTAEGRLSAWILMLLPFVLIVLIGVLNPEYISKLATTGPGILMALIGVSLLVVGGLWLRKVVVIEV